MKKLKGIAIFIAAMTMAVGFSTAVKAEFTDENKIISADFDGNDDTSLWRKMGSGQVLNTNNSSDISVFLENTDEGYTCYTRNSTSYGAWGIWFGEWDAAHPVKQNQTGINMEMRFKIEGNIPDNELLTVRAVRNNKGNRDHQDWIAKAEVKSGKLCLTTTSTIATEYDISSNKWYTMNLQMDYKNQYATLTVTDDEGNSVTKGQVFRWVFTFTWEDIINICAMNTDVGDGTEKYYIDYFRMWDESFLIKNTSIKDGAEAVRTDTDFNADFSAAVKAVSLKGITVTDSEGNAVPAEITAAESSVNIFFPAGLKYEEKYKITLPDTIVSEAGDSISTAEINFTTEPPAFVTGAMKTVISGGKCITRMKAENNSTTDKDIYILTVIYDANKNVVKMTNEKITIPAGKEKTISAVTTVSGIEKPSAKAFLWDGLNLE